MTKRKLHILFAKRHSTSNMGSTALKSHDKSEEHKKSAASVNDRQIKITNVFVNTSKFESTSVSPAFKQDDTSSVSPPLNDNNSTAKHDVKNNVQSSSSSTFFIGENITRAEILRALHVSYKHYSYRSCSEIGQFFQKMFPDMPRINAKKLYHEKKQAKQAKMPAAGNFFFHIGTAIFNFS